MSHQKKVFLLKMLIFCLVVFGLFEWFRQSSWKLSYEEQAYLRCLPIELTLTHHREITKSDLYAGALVVLKTDRYSKFYRNGVQILKVIAGVPGDYVSIGQGKIYVNDNFIATYVENDDKGFPPAFIGTRKLEEGQYWVSGSTAVSLDSRYIGPVGLQDFIGKGYAIL